MELFILLVLVIAFDSAALKWGINSGEGLRSLEWEKRRLRGHVL